MWSLEREFGISWRPIRECVLEGMLFWELGRREAADDPLNGSVSLLVDRVWIGEVLEPQLLLLGCFLGKATWKGMQGK